MTEVPRPCTAPLGSLGPRAQGGPARVPRPQPIVADARRALRYGGGHPARSAALTEDPFRHHPGLKALLTPPETSFFRDIHPARIVGMLEEKGLPTDWIRSPEEIDALRRAALDGHEGDLWVFGYGSLMWDPAIDFVELRRARLPGYVRSFCLLDVKGGRGDPEQPGVMAALDTGGACEGLAFRIPADRVEDETRRLWYREQIGPAYRAVFAPAETPGENDDGRTRPRFQQSTPAQWSATRTFHRLRLPRRVVSVR